MGETWKWEGTYHPGDSSIVKPYFKRIQSDAVQKGLKGKRPTQTVAYDDMVKLISWLLATDTTIGI